MVAIKPIVQSIAVYGNALGAQVHGPQNSWSQHRVTDAGTLHVAVSHDAWASAAGCNTPNGVHVLGVHNTETNQTTYVAPEGQLAKCTHEQLESFVQSHLHPNGTIVAEHSELTRRLGGYNIINFSARLTGAGIVFNGAIGWPVIGAVVVAVAGYFWWNHSDTDKSGIESIPTPNRRRSLDDASHVAKRAAQDVIFEYNDVSVNGRTIAHSSVDDDKAIVDFCGKDIEMQGASSGCCEARFVSAEKGTQFEHIGIMRSDISVNCY
ncbi:uncharacterized protein PFL1_05462 [Pseudozyma flocculosa PF-1]|uniref:Uncharacterized protein n=2 Tax=Pseudozyma flocculosa TaxID=84751 RepID=A0A5C3FCE0_9BASI|nr:uncharacterized protein PFL1_05462 [Pseudozyma flocculosa PF-1]EPQ26827.1 hypothetical protein PFL1_05462 [Pseudozyma flocculosa PF-1]SPO42104.1 uncharacterized protein PSFLO_07587 [Pseudozyma flocculosa]